MEDRTERIGRNEALFRHVNERIQELNEGFAMVLDDFEFVCECGDATCADAIRMPLDEYERIRSTPTWFAVRAGHELPEVESVIERHGAYNVVEKHAGDAAELAREEDPRS